MSIRVLIISHNSFSSFQNMGKTLNSLFGSFPKESLFHLYFHKSYPDIDACQSVFRITDNDIIRNMLRLRKGAGEIVSSQFVRKGNQLFNGDKTERLHKAKYKIKALVAFRDILWCLKTWDTKELNSWIKSIKPDAIFFAAGDAIFPFTISQILSKRFNIPLFTYFCDDYYFFNDNSKSVLYKIQKKYLKRKIAEIGNNSKKSIYISPELERDYAKIFGKRGEVIMTPYNYAENLSATYNSQLVITYAGNLSLGRWKTLIAIGNSISKINKNEQKVILRIYSSITDKEIIDKLNIPNAMNFMGNVPYEELKNIMQESHVLLHAESFEEDNINRVKYSISSKVPDYLASKRLILAVGPNCISSIKYLKKNKVAFVIDSLDDIEIKTELLINDFCDYEYLIDNSEVLAMQNHNIDTNSNRLKSIIESQVNIKRRKNNV